MHCYWLMCLKTLEIRLKIQDLDPAHFYSAAPLTWIAALKMTKAYLQLLTNIDMLLIFQKGYTKDNKHMKNYGKDNNQSYLV